jgi:aminopeptidase N
MSCAGSAFPILLILAAQTAAASETFYNVKLTVDLDRQEIVGREEIRFTHPRGDFEWQKQAGLRLLHSSGDVDPADTTVRTRFRSDGSQHLKFEYTATAARGLRWLPDKGGLFTAFYCEAWMVCSTAPGQRATLRLEIVIPGSALTAVGPGKLRRGWEDHAGRHFLYEQSEPAQTYLFSFCVARLKASTMGEFTVYSSAPDRNGALRRTADAAAFMRKRAGVDAIRGGYRQAFLAQAGLAQESSDLALLSEDYLAKLEQEDDVVLMAHELAHQWWGKLVGIRSWSDSWLNEGMAEFISLVYLEQERGHPAYVERIDRLKSQMAEIRGRGADRPLHFESWTDVRDALGRVPYVKGALFLDRLRTELGEEAFWRGMALYTARYAWQLVDSRDFQRAMEEAGGRTLDLLFLEVYGN